MQRWELRRVRRRPLLLLFVVVPHRYRAYSLQRAATKTAWNRKHGAYPLWHSQYGSKDDRTTLCQQRRVLVCGTALAGVTAGKPRSVSPGQLFRHAHTGGKQ